MGTPHCIRVSHSLTEDWNPKLCHSFTRGFLFWRPAEEANFLLSYRKKCSLGLMKSQGHGLIKLKLCRTVSVLCYANCTYRMLPSVLLLLSENMQPSCKWTSCGISFTGTRARGTSTCTAVCAPSNSISDRSHC